MRYYHLKQKKRSQMSEKTFAKVIEGRVTPASGALRMKGDVKSDFFLGEDKFTDKQSYSLKKSIWQKIKLEAFNCSRKPLMRIDIDGEVLYVLDEQTLKQMLASQKQ